MLILTTLLMPLIFGMSAGASPLGGSGEEEFLPVREAFQSLLEYENGRIITEWQIADDYYMYRHRFQFSLAENDQATLGEPVFSREGKHKHDEAFGDVEVYYHQVKVEIPVERAQGGDIHLTTRFLGCAEAGLCYPPETIETTFTVPPTGAGQASGNSSDSNASGSGNQPKTSSQAEPAPPADTESATGIASLLESSGFLGAVALMFVAGLGLTFTPCILPMLPILSSVIVGQKEEMSATRGFVLSTGYVGGMAITYAVAGFMFGLTGAKLQLIMQNPYVLFGFAAVFVALAFSMFGFYELQLPAAIRNRLDNIGHQQQGGHIIGVFIMGIVAALVASPCISAPLAAALIYIAKTGDPWFGAMALLALGFGIGTPLIILGTTGGNIMPRAGAWMNAVKGLFGVLLLAVAAWLIKHLLPDTVMMLIWAALLIIPAIYMGALHHVETGWQKLWKGVGVVMLIYGTTLVIGVATGGSNPLKPLENLAFRSAPQATGKAEATSLAFQRVRTKQELTQALQQAADAGQPAMLDYYADWCIACVEMEHGTFQHPRVKDMLKDYRLIQVDLTNNPQDDPLLDRFDLIGPPSILFFDAQGEEIRPARIVGEMNAKRFIDHLTQKVADNTRVGQL